MLQYNATTTKLMMEARDDGARGARNLGNRNESRVVPPVPSVLKGSVRTVRTEVDIKLVGGHP